eukprot:m.95948 g.95948  ORF g.95948 m.95948 type:complete len:195 (+) comp12345_c0_seq2:318-902(+)
MPPAGTSPLKGTMAPVSDGAGADGTGADVNQSDRVALNASEKRDLAQIFHLVDRTGTGVLDWVELRRCLRGLGFPVSKKETRSLVRAKCGAEGFVTLRQFFEIVDELGSTKRDATREIKHGFKLFTGEGQHITETDLRRAAVTADISADVSKMLAIADVDGDGKVGREDFIHIMSRTALFARDMASTSLVLAET